MCVWVGGWVGGWVFVLVHTHFTYILLHLCTYTSFEM